MKTCLGGDDGNKTLKISKREIFNLLSLLTLHFEKVYIIKQYKGDKVKAIWL